MSDTAVVETEECEAPAHAGPRWVVSIDEHGYCAGCAAVDHNLEWGLPRMASGVTRGRDGRFTQARR